MRNFLMTMAPLTLALALTVTPLMIGADGVEAGDNKKSKATTSDLPVVKQTDKVSPRQAQTRKKTTVRESNDTYGRETNRR